MSHIHDVVAYRAYTNGIDVMEDTPLYKLPIYWSGSAMIDSRPDVPRPRPEHDFSGRYEPELKKKSPVKKIHGFRFEPNYHVRIRIYKRLRNAQITNVVIGKFIDRGPSSVSHLLMGRWKWRREEWRNLISLLRKTEKKMKIQAQKDLY